MKIFRVCPLEYNLQIVDLYEILQNNCFFWRSGLPLSTVSVYVCMRSDWSDAAKHTEVPLVLSFLVSQFFYSLLQICICEAHYS